MSQREPVASGAMALFGEAATVSASSPSATGRELCGGPHAGSSGKARRDQAAGESSIGSGVRRVEALVGSDAYRFLAREHVLVNQLSDTLKGASRAAARARQRHRREAPGGREGDREVRVSSCRGRRELAAGAVKVRPVNLVAHRADGTGGGDVRTLALDVRGRLPQGEPGSPWSSGPSTARSRSWRPSTTRTRRGLSANELVPHRRAAGRWQGRWQGRRGPGWGHRQLADRRGARCGRHRGRPARRVSPGPAMRHGVRLGIDPGTPGSASRAATHRVLATPVETVRRGKGDLARIAAIAAGEAVEVVVGLPRSLSRTGGAGGRQGA